jgi:hypothetical protein
MGRWSNFDRRLGPASVHDRIYPQWSFYGTAKRKKAQHPGDHGRRHRLDDKNKFLPTVHGFDEFFGNLAYNLRSDPFERADESAMPFQTSNQLFFIVPAQAVVARWLSTFKDFPPRQKPSSFNVDDVVRKLADAAARGLDGI